MQSRYVEVETTISIWNNHIQLRRVALDLHYCTEYQEEVKEKKQMWNVLITLEMASLQNSNNYNKTWWISWVTQG